MRLKNSTVGGVLPFFCLFSLPVMAEQTLLYEKTAATGAVCGERNTAGSFF